MQTARHSSARAHFAIAIPQGTSRLATPTSDMNPVRAKINIFSNF
jgi:hypothetical protein